MQAGTRFINSGRVNARSNVRRGVWRGRRLMAVGLLCALLPPAAPRGVGAGARTDKPRAATGAASRQETAADKPITLRVNAASVQNHITPWMFGSCIEDVNHEIYGGLYAQQIFGESFEEPPIAQSPLSGWQAYGGQWQVRDGALRVEPEAGAKLVRDGAGQADGQAECDIRIESNPPGNAALLVRVSDPHNGPDNWTGYEVALDANTHTVSFSRHHNDWHFLRAAPAPVQAKVWHHLRVALRGPVLRLFLDHAAQPVLEYTDTQGALLSGQVGLRTWNTRAAFRNLTLTSLAGQSMSDPLTQGVPQEISAQVSGMWDRLQTGTSRGRWTWDAGEAVNTTRSQAVSYDSGSGTVGIINRGLNRSGIGLRAKQAYAGSVYLKQQGDANSNRSRVTVALQSADGTRTYALSQLDAGPGQWTRRDFTLRPDTNDPNARFALWLDRPGSVKVDQVTLMPTGKALFKGLPLRRDVGEAIVNQGVRFLRYGGTMVNAPEYKWKNMIGPRALRPQYRGNWYPHSTNGFGIEEFVQFCRAAHIEPAFAINIDETPDDAADLVEYLNGPSTSPWGLRRAQNGHSAPYAVRYIEIGNEEGLNGDTAWYRRYLERFQLLYPAMRARDPNLQLVIAAWWNPNEAWCKTIMQALNGKAALWDVHVDADNLADGATVDRTLTQMQRLFAQWASGTTMRACIFEENGNRHDFQRALSHAYVLNVTRRHGDFCLMDCPANCLQVWRQNDNGWDQGQIFLTPDQVWGMPPFYAQQMAAQNALPLCVEARMQDAPPGLDVTVTRDEAGSVLVLSGVNVTDSPQRVEVQLTGFEDVASVGEAWTLTGDLKSVNTLAQPRHIAPVHTNRTDIGERFAWTLPAHAYTILRLRRAPTHKQ